MRTLISDADVFRALEAGLPSRKSSANYRIRLEAARKRVGAPSVVAMLLSPLKYVPVLKREYLNTATRNNVVVAVLSVFKHVPLLAGRAGESLMRWRHFAGVMGRVLQIRSDKNKMTDDQRAKMMSFNEIEMLFAQRMALPPHEQLVFHSTRPKSQQFVLLALVADGLIVRSDLGNVRILETDPMTSDDNYAVIRKNNGPSYIVLNKYKTHRTYGRYAEDIGHTALGVLRESLRLHPRSHLFVDNRGHPYEENSSYGAFVRRTFQTLFGRMVGTSMLRHIFITDKLDPTRMSAEELKDSSRRMMHSMGMQQRYRFVN